ncbi:hypothetical protein T05_16444 [Trichinella murrelli]|uniref:Uncharacterized protein n=1 Tax=Trichinella murrelli TaxID=144512 RepID=A0A0V0UB47_9BILA|nr:hypothetical protein T05_16444 [Trichinella murrelli]
MDYARFHHNYVPYVVIDGWSRHILNSVVIAYGKEVSTKSKIFDAVVKASCIQQLMTDLVLCKPMPWTVVSERDSNLQQHSLLPCLHLLT